MTRIFDHELDESNECGWKRGGRIFDHELDESDESNELLSTEATSDWRLM